MIFIPRIFALLAISLALISCQDEEKPSKQEIRIAKDQFFTEEPKLALSDLKNEMAKGETDLLRSFAKQDFPWQHWDQSLLKKAKSCQSPIFVLLTNPLNESSRDLAKHLVETPPYNKVLSEHYLCTIADIHARPELGILAYHLCTEISQPVSFPMIMWLSHEGNPIAWIPVGEIQHSQIERIFQNSHAMVQDMWTREQSYSVENSHQDNYRRQRRLDHMIKHPKPDDDDDPLEPHPNLNRQRSFLEGARRITSFYDKHSKDLDGIGGLLPSSALKVLALQTAYPATYSKTKERSHTAILGVYDSLSRGAIHDGVDGGYFYARRNYGWTLPSFSKDLVSQSLLSQSLLQSGALLGNSNIVAGGAQLLAEIERVWMGDSPKSTLSAGSRQDADNVFLFEYKVIKELLSPADFAVAQEFYQLKPDGNINAINDSRRKYLGLNTLAPTKTITEISQALNLSDLVVSESLGRIRKQIGELRKKNSKFSIETEIATSSFALFGSTQVSLYQTNPKPSHLQKALKTGKALLANYTKNGVQLRRFKNKLNARGIDYAQTINFLLDLYTATFDKNWLNSACQLTDEAIARLGRTNLPLLETELSGEVIQLKIHHTSMIFAESSLGKFDHALGRLAALTGKKTYREQRSLIWKSLHRSVHFLPIIHTDLLASNLITDNPYLIILEGNPASEEFQQTLMKLNHPKISSYSVLRPAGDSSLAAHPDLGPKTSEFRLNLVKGGDLLGQTTSFSEFQQILEKALSQKE